MPATTTYIVTNLEACIAVDFGITNISLFPRKPNNDQYTDA